MAYVIPSEPRGGSPQLRFVPPLAPQGVTARPRRTKTMFTNETEFQSRPTTVVRLIDRLVMKPLASWRARQAALDELAGLDDHMLADIGIARSEIPGIVSGRIAPRRATNENEPSVAA